MSTASVVGLAAYSFMPAPAIGLQLNSGLSGIPAASESGVILIEEKKKDIKDVKKDVKKMDVKKDVIIKKDVIKKDVIKKDVIKKDFKKDGKKDGKKKDGKWGDGGGWKKHGKWHHGDRWSGGYWRRGVWVVAPFFIGDECYDYVERWPGGPVAWVYICEE
jgi:hypothetical protein